ncbi:MAG: protein kinase [Myxococcales bacterium]|nr:protein kinase [Myxococcales bacterium]
MATASTLEARTGTVLDTRYRIRSPLRCEGAGKLECAEERSTGRRMAIRFVPLAANGERATKALQEMPLHPTLPKIRDTGTVGDQAFVAMDFPEGKLLSAFAPAEVVPQLRSIGADLSDALATLHAERFFHGELGTDSVLVLGGGRSILWDTPLVMVDRLTDRRGGERALAALKRKAPCLSPECARGLPASSAADVYSLAVVLCLCSGSPPPDSNVLGALHAIATGQWRPAIPETLPEILRGSLSRMLHPDPFMRPSARDVADAWGQPVVGVLLGAAARAVPDGHPAGGGAGPLVLGEELPPGYVLSDGPCAEPAEPEPTPSADAEPRPAAPKRRRMDSARFDAVVQRLSRNDFARRDSDLQAPAPLSVGGRGHLPWVMLAAALLAAVAASAYVLLPAGPVRFESPGPINPPAVSAPQPPAPASVSAPPELDQPLPASSAAATALSPSEVVPLAKEPPPAPRSKKATRGERVKSRLARKEPAPPADPSPSPSAVSPEPPQPELKRPSFEE